MRSLFARDDVYLPHFLAYLTGLFSLTPARCNILLSSYETLVEAVEDSFRAIHPRPRWLKEFEMQASFWKDFAIFDETIKHNQVAVITYFDQSYPSKLKHLAKPPLVLFYQGRLDVLEKKDLVTVVGSRLYTKYGELLLDTILQPNCRKGLGVVSGLAVGIDGLAHEAALKGGAVTVGVIGSGLDEESFYPQKHLGLKHRIIDEGGLVMSEYAPGTRAASFTFPARNRILSALTELTWVVQASVKSGSLITASRALELGKTVATSPGSIFESSLSGNLQLIKEGAQIITNSEDIGVLLGLKSHPEIYQEVVLTFDTELEKRVYDQLGLAPSLVGDLGEKLSVSAAEILAALTVLELNGLAAHLGENTWVRSG